MTNQSPPLVGHDVLRTDLALVDAVRTYARPDALDGLSELGVAAGSEQAQRWGAEANAHPRGCAWV